MKITRDQLKSIVKECLAEILIEGLGDAGLVENHTSGKHRGVLEAAKRQRVVNRTAMSRVGNLQNENLKRAVDANAGDNPVLRDILADTAVTTLQEQLKGERMGPVGAVERVVADSTPEQLFGDDNASRWADLAFMDNGPGLVKKTS